jgi:hypothetical protein
VLLQEPSGVGVFNISTLAGRGLSKGMIAVEHELQPAADWVFQTGCFARESTVPPRCFQRLGHFAPLSFTAYGGKIQTTRFAGGR